MSSFRTPLLVAAGALLTLVGIDLGIRPISPMPPPLMEVEEGMADYGQRDPDTLAIGSSHTRSFVPIRDELNKSGDRMAVIPVEAGTMQCYQWVLDHRLRPLMEEKVDGRPKRVHLTRFIFVTTFYDITTKAEQTNLPGRAWLFSHFAEDVAEHGVTDFNRNYLSRRFNRWFFFSDLVQGHERIVGDFQERFRSRAALDWNREGYVKGWQKKVEEWYASGDDPNEKRAFLEMLDYLTSKKIEVVMAVFPLMPLSLTEKSKNTTVKRYAEYLAELSRKYPIHVVDMTYDSPLTDADFMADMDHVSLPGNQKFAAWALANDLAFLRTPAKP